MNHIVYRLFALILLFIISACGGGGSGGDGSSPVPADTTAPNTSISHSTQYFSDNLVITLNCADTGGSGCSAIYYTLDNTTPSTSSTKYTGPITISHTTTLKFFSIDGDGNRESVRSETYTLTSFERHVAADVSVQESSLAFTDLYGYTKMQLLYPAANIAGAGYIDSISFIRSRDQPTAITCQNTTIRMGHTSLVALTDTYTDNIEQGRGALITVIDDQTLNFPAGGPNAPVSFTLVKPFYYNGVDNLVVEIERTATCSGKVYVKSEYMGLNADVRLFVATPQATGSLTDYLQHMEFDFRGGDTKLIEFDALNMASFVPFGASSNKVQLLYYADEIKGRGTITGIGFPVNDIFNGNSLEQSYTVTVRLGHSTLQDLTTNFAANFSDTPITVANNVSFTATGGIARGDYIWLPMPDGRFDYNGTDNLLVEIEVLASSGNTYWLVKDGIPHRRAYGIVGNANAIGTNGNVYGLKLRFAGSTVDVVTDGLGTDNFPFNSDPNRRQYLFTAAELGGSGVINKIAHRLKDDATTIADYSSCRVMLGHTTLSSLGGTSFAANMIDETEVYNADYSIPISKAGDWVEMPLNGVFNYDGIRNLVVDMSCTSGSEIHGLSGTATDATIRYPGRRAYLGEAA